MEQQKRVFEWVDDGMDDIMANIPYPKRLRTDEWGGDVEADDNLAMSIPKEMLGGLPVKMNFKEHFTVKLLKQRYKKKFGTTQYLYDVKVDNLPYHLGNASSMLALPELFQAIMDACTKEFLPEDRMCIELNCRNFNLGSIYLPAVKFKNFNVDTLMLQMERLNSQKKFCIVESFKLKLTKICLPSGGSNRRIKMRTFRQAKKDCQ